VLKPGGRLAFSVWDSPERAAGFGAIYAAIRAHGSLDVGIPEGPNFFLFSGAAERIEALRNAGFEDPTFRQMPQFWRLSDPDQLFAVIAAGTVRVAAVLRAQSAEARQAIREEVRNAMSAYRRGDTCEVPMPAVIAAAVKPSR